MDGAGDARETQRIRLEALTGLVDAPPFGARDLVPRFALGERRHDARARETVAADRRPARGLERETRNRRELLGQLHTRSLWRASARSNGHTLVSMREA